jgi:hypothetical protein
VDLLANIINILLFKAWMKRHGKSFFIIFFNVWKHPFPETKLLIKRIKVYGVIMDR